MNTLDRELQIFLFPPPRLFFTPNIPILPLVEKFRIYLPKFFSKFTLEKVRDLNFELLFVLVKMENWGEKELGGGKRKIHSSKL
jgi:hypothetical protein